MKIPSYAVPLLAVVVLLLQRYDTYAQFPIQFLPATTADWNTPTNWEDVGAGQNVPSSEFDEIGVINTGGTAQVSNTPVSPGGVVIDDGALEILGTGVLTVVPGFGNLAQGEVEVNGSGMLSVAPGGMLSAQSLASSGVVRLTGTSATFNVTDQLTFEQGGSLIAEITASSHSVISVGGTANLGGALVADFTGHMPAASESWDLVTASTIAGSFDSITPVGIGPLPLGQTLAVRTTAGGPQGMVARLSIENRLVLTVDRDSGAMSIDNPHGVPFAMDSYAIQSVIGSIDGGAWNSFEDQGLDGNAWFETGSGGTSHRLAELTLDGETLFPAMSSTTLGSVYAPNFTAFGEEIEDYTFTYSALDGRILEGQVNYIGDKQFNNVVLTVDPSSGDAQIRNESEFPVSIEGYVVLSESGSLLSGDGDWQSLQDQGVEGGAWFEANVSATQVVELRDDGATFLAKNQGYNIGQLFNTGADQDLTFEFLIAGESVPMEGVVVYGSLPLVNDPGQLLAGDYNNDGTVDAADYTVWRDNLGSSIALPNDATPGAVTQSDYVVWRNNYGATASASAAASASTAVPEPSVALLVVTCLLPIRRFGGVVRSPQ